MTKRMNRAGIAVLGALLLIEGTGSMALAQEPPTPAAGEIRWAPGMEGALILGLDGGLYEPYAVSVVERVQQALETEGLYDGTVSGILDGPTMEALAEYQRSNGLSPSGVPSPSTRSRLLAE